MKILQIGCGGIGSYLIPEIAECIEQEQIDSFSNKITIADSDIVELEQIKRKYQNFKYDDVGMNKAKVLADRYKLFGERLFNPITERIEKESQLKGYDLIILCVDNEKTREMVIRYCHEHNKEFIDLRATGRRFFAMPKERRLQNNLRFVDTKDLMEYSCQDIADLEKGFIQKGNKIVAQIGNQMLLNLMRGHSNRTIIMGV